MLNPPRRLLCHSFPLMLFRPLLLLPMALSLPFCDALLNGQNNCYNCSTQKQKIISMDPSNLDLVFFRSAIFALFKAKADTILFFLPPTERIVFGQCELDADGRLNMLAKCLVSLFNIRDFRLNSTKNSNGNGIKSTELPWISAISRKIFETVETAKRTEKEKSEEMSKEKANKLKKNLLKLEEILGGKKAQKKEKQMNDRSKVMAKLAKLRPKREGEKTEELTEHELKQYPHVLKMIRVERFYRILDKCNEYIRRKDDEHSKFLQLYGLPFQLQTKSADQNPLFGLAKMQLRQSVDRDKLSILSPKLLSIIPDSPNRQSLLTSLRHNSTSVNSSDDVLSALLSPNLFSFYAQGEFSLPFLLRLGLSNRTETIAWLDLLLRISGASSTLDRIISSIGPEFEAVERRIYPSIVRLEEIEKRFRKLRMSESKKQRKEMASRGYTFISEQQSRVVFGEATTEDALDTETDMERVLEQDIRTIARMNNGDNEAERHWMMMPGAGRARRKRFLRTEPFGQLRLLNPYLFANQIHDGAVMRRVALSPRAFSSSILSPEFGQLEVLSPRAFLAIILSPRAAIANILSPSAFTLRLLSPQALMAEVLNPKAFTARILSPRAMSAFVLSPRALITTILSPKMLELRILSPTTLAFTLLSPTIGGVKVASAQSFSMVVLSPSILSPSFLNKGTGNIRVLSPSILSGGGGGGEK